MFIPIIDYKNLFVADFSNDQEKVLKIIFSKYPNFCLDGQIIYPFAKEVITDDNILVSNSQHVKKIGHYVTCFGFPKKNISSGEKEKQDLVVQQVKLLRKLRKI